MSTANYFHVIGDDKPTKSAECVFFMITNGRIPTIDEMTTDEFDLVDLRMSSRLGQWELQGLEPSGKALDYVSMCGTDLLGEQNTENMYWMFVILPAEVIQVTQGMSMIHGEFSKFFCTEIDRILQRRNGWTFGYIARDTTMFYRDSKSLCSGY